MVAFLCRGLPQLNIASTGPLVGLLLLAHAPDLALKPPELLLGVEDFDIPDVYGLSELEQLLL